MEPRHNSAAAACDSFHQCRITDESSPVFSEPDVQVLTSGGRYISAHSGILTSASPVLESMIDQSNKRRNAKNIFRILGVPCDAVSAFVTFLYSSKCTEDEMEKYGIHLLTLSHVYKIPDLKHRSIKGVSERLTIDNVVDVLQLSRMCDAPDLHLRCMKFISGHFRDVEKTEGWIFMQQHDPWLELEILQFIDEAESRRKRSRRQKKQQDLYRQLIEAMECLEHICTEGCINVGPYDVAQTIKKLPCSKFSTCQGVQLSIRHFATCKKRVNGGCLRCKRMWQLLRLHSSICDQPDSSCKIPLCRRFKQRSQQEHGKKEKDEKMWTLLVRKVVAAKATCSLSPPKRNNKAEEEEDRVTRSYKFCN